MYVVIHRTPAHRRLKHYGDADLQSAAEIAVQTFDPKWSVFAIAGFAAVELSPKRKGAKPDSMMIVQRESPMKYQVAFATLREWRLQEVEDLPSSIPDGSHRHNRN